MTKENDGLRNRRSTKSGNTDVGADQNDLKPSDAVANADTVVASVPVTPNSGSTSSGSKRIQTIIFALKWVVHLAAIACFVAGIILRTNQLHTGEECDMTYSMRKFLKVDTVATRKDSEFTSPATSQYGLYKFVDQRDPRYKELLKAASPLGRDEHCANSSDNILVYVPGHWGSYDQARSLGAHGTGMTRARENTWHAGKRLMNHNNNTSKEDFVYDVYALDFAEQGGGLHGQFLRYQADYLASVLEQLAEDCGNEKNLMVVAHSMGGYVARKVLMENPGLGGVENLITLATPHSNPLYSFDRSVSEFHREIQNGKTELAENSKQPLVVSISGGLRDEMIEPSVCGVSTQNTHSAAGWLFGTSQGLAEESNDNTLASYTILATRLMAHVPYSKKRKISGLGMDHRAIVWCHQVLEEVRHMIWVLINYSERPAEKRRDKVIYILKKESEYSYYADDLEYMGEELSVKFGKVGAICMEASMIYNLPYLLALYASLIGFRCAKVTPERRVSSMLPVWATILLGWIFRSDLGSLATVILALVANSVNLVLVRLLPKGFLLRSRASEQKLPLRVLRSALITTLKWVITAAFGVVIALRYLFGPEKQMLIDDNWFGLFTVTLYVYTTISIYVLLMVLAGFIDTRVGDKANENKMEAGGNESFEIQLITFVMMVVPFLVAGPLALMASEQRTQLSSWWTLLSLQVPVGSLVWIRLKQIDAFSEGDEETRKTREFSPPLRPKNYLILRSISIYLGLLYFLCGYGLLSRGTGYLVPDLGKMLVWVGIEQSLVA